MEKAPYQVVITPLEDALGGGFLATIPDLPGCMADGETEFLALEMVLDAKQSWLAAARLTPPSTAR